MFLKKEQNKTTEEGLSEVDIGSLPNKEFRIVTVKINKELGKVTVVKMSILPN